MSETPNVGDEFHHPDGTTETVFAIREGHVLTVREYRDIAAFQRAVEAADAAGSNPLVEELSLQEFASAEDRDSG